MPKAILEFNLPEELCEFKLAVTGSDWADVVWSLHSELRSIDKHGRHGLNSMEDLIEHLRNFLSETIEDNGVGLDMIR